MSWPTLCYRVLLFIQKTKNYMIQSIFLVMQSVRTSGEAELVFHFLIIVIVMNRWRMLSEFLKARQQ